MGIDPNQICKQAWRRIVFSTDVDPSLYARFDDRCLDNMVNAENFTPSKQCNWEQSGDKFILDNNGKKKELPEAKVVTCLVGLAAAEKWLEKQVTAVKLPDAPKVVGLPVEATPSVVAAPDDVTPVDAAKDATATAVGLPSEVTPTSGSGFSWFSRIFLEIGGGPWLQSIGLSVNGAAPVQKFGDAVFSLRAGGLFTHTKLSDNWGYETAVFATMAALIDNKFADVYDFGGGISPQFSYTLPEISKKSPRDCKLIFAPDVGMMAGILWFKDPIDVGIPDKLYWAKNSYTFPEMTVGMGVYLDLHTSYKDLSFTVGVHSGARMLWHKDSVTNLPAGMPAGTEVRLKSPMVDVLQWQFGFRY